MCKFKDYLLEEAVFFLMLAILVFIAFWFFPNVIPSMPNVILQGIAILLLAVILCGLERIVLKYFKRIGNYYRCYKLVLIVGCISLGNCSLEELVYLGFHLTKETAMNYLTLKVLFNLIGLYNLPSALALLPENDGIFKALSRLRNLSR